MNYSWGAGEWAVVGVFVFTILFTVIGYFLSRKDTKQDSDRKEDNDRNTKQFELLFKKHDEDVNELKNLQREIDKNHYERGDVDRLVSRLEDAVTEGFSLLGAKFDLLSGKIEVLGTKMAEHVGREDREKE